MKKFIWTLIFMLCLVGQSALAADFSKLVILHTNDSHGFDMHVDGSVGMDGVAAYKKDLEAKGYDVVMLDGGDAIQDNNLVNFSFGKSAIDFMNAIGYDAAAFGNHEFDYGQDILQQRVSEAKFPYLCCNVKVDATGKYLGQPTLVLNRPSGKIGIVGFSTPETQVSTSPKNVFGLSFMEGKELYQEAQKQIDKLKAEGCDLIIGLGHMGSEDGCMGNRSDDIIMNTKGLAMFVDGHDHRVKGKYYGNVLLAEAGCHTKNIGKITFDGSKWVGEMVNIDKWQAQDPVVTHIINQYNDQVQKHLGVKLGRSMQFMDASREPGVRTHEMPIGDFIADAYLWQAQQANVLKGKVHAAICNGGSIRSKLPKGIIKRFDIVSTAPFNNQLYVATIKGSKLLEIMEAATSTLPDAMGALPQVAGMEYVVDTRVPYAAAEKYPNSVFFAPAKPGSRVTIKTVDGKPFDANASYTVAMTEFLVLGGDNYGGLALPGAKEAGQSIGYVDAQAIENYLVTALKGKLGPQYAQAQGRFTVIK